jgi:MPBQ/MSBQ methyltransferase
METVSSFVSNNAVALAVFAAVSVLVVALINSFKKGSRKYDGNVGEEYDAWTEEGILEHYWGEHIHLGYYADHERRDGKLFAWGKKNFKQVRTRGQECVAHGILLIVLH